MGVNLNLNTAASAPELPQEIVFNIFSWIREDERSKLALLSRQFYTYVVNLEREEAKVSLKERIASIHTGILGSVDELCEVAKEQELLNRLQQTLDSAFAREHFNKRRDVVKKRHELQQEICQIMIQQNSICKAFLKDLSCQVNAIAPGKGLGFPDLDIAHTAVNRRMMQLFLYAKTCSDLNWAQSNPHFESTALMDLTKAHRLDEAFALFKKMTQAHRGAFPYDSENQHAVILLVKLLTSAKLLSDVKFIYGSLDKMAKAQIMFAGDTLLYKKKNLAFTALVWKTAEDTPNSHLMKLIDALN